MIVVLLDRELFEQEKMFILKKESQTIYLQVRNCKYASIFKSTIVNHKCVLNVGAEAKLEVVRYNH